MVFALVHFYLPARYLAQSSHRLQRVVTKPRLIFIEKLNIYIIKKTLISTVGLWNRNGRDSEEAFSISGKIKIKLKNDAGAIGKKAKIMSLICLTAK